MRLIEIEESQLRQVLPGVAVLFHSTMVCVSATREEFMGDNSPEDDFLAWEWQFLVAGDGPQETILWSTPDLLKTLRLSLLGDEDDFRFFVITEDEDEEGWLLHEDLVGHIEHTLQLEEVG